MIFEEESRRKNAAWDAEIYQESSCNSNTWLYITKRLFQIDKKKKVMHGYVRLKRGLNQFEFKLEHCCFPLLQERRMGLILNDHHQLVEVMYKNVIYILYCTIRFLLPNDLHI